MYRTEITTREAGQRFDKYLHRILPNAGSSFLYKMLRKKNILLNDKKADGSEKIAAGDSVTIYFSDETLAQFMGTNPFAGTVDYGNAYRMISGVKIIYENDHILLADKPAGILSQKAQPADLSLNEWLIGYLLDCGSMTAQDLTLFKPSVCNRLDRNTSGIVLCAKSLLGAQMLGELLKDRTLHKYYQLYVKGHVTKEHTIEGYLHKDVKRNKVSIIPASEADAGILAGKTTHPYIKTAYKPLKNAGDKTLLEVELITGKSHQIRAHLASIGHPLLGDYKYGDPAWNEQYRKKYQIRSQLLHACRVVFPELKAPFEDLSGQTFCADMPEIFQIIDETLYKCPNAEHHGRK